MLILVLLYLLERPVPEEVFLLWVFPLRLCRPLSGDLPSADLAWTPEGGILRVVATCGGGSLCAHLPPVPLLGMQLAFEG